MSLHKKILGLVFILISMVSSGCARSNDSLRTPSPESPSYLHTDNASPTETLPSPILSPTLTFEPSSTSISTYIPTHTSTPSLKPVIISTLSAEEARARLLDLLADNGGCRLPCLWGITPGVSTDQEARAILEPLSSISEYTDFGPGPGTIEPSYIMTEDIKHNFFIAFLANNHVVNHIVFEGRTLKELGGEGGMVGVYGLSLFGERMSPYMLTQVLSEYGRPTSVWISTLSGIPPGSDIDPGIFHILLLYPDQGFLVNYTTDISVVGENVVGCPAYAHVELELFPLGNNDSFPQLLTATGWTELIKDEYKSLEKSTSMSIKEFYQTFSQSEDECLVTPSDLWPEPRGSN